MEEKNGTVFRNFFFRERLKECVCVEREGQISRIDYICLFRRTIGRNVRLIVSSAQNL